MNENELTQVAGGIGDNFFKIIVLYTAVPRSNPSDILDTGMTFAVEPEETVGHIEQRFINFCGANGGEIQTIFNGAPVGKEITMTGLGIRERETLVMKAALYGGGWGI